MVPYSKTKSLSSLESHNALQQVKFKITGVKKKIHINLFYLINYDYDNQISFSSFLVISLLYNVKMTKIAVMVKPYMKKLISTVKKEKKKRKHCHFQICIENNNILM